MNPQKAVNLHKRALCIHKKVLLCIYSIKDLCITKKKIESIHPPQKKLYFYLTNPMLSKCPHTHTHTHTHTHQNIRRDMAQAAPTVFLKNLGATKFYPPQPEKWKMTTWCLLLLLVLSFLAGFHTQTKQQAFAYCMTWKIATWLQLFSRFSICPTVMCRPLPFSRDI